MTKTNGKKPRGRGHWGFFEWSNVIWYTGTMIEAKKSATSEAKAQYCNRVEVAS